MPFALAFARRRLGGEERIVDALNVLLRDAGAGVGNDHADAFAVGSGNAQRSAIRHGVLGVQEQVQKHLLQPPGIAADQRQVLRQFILHLNLGALELVLQQRQRVEMICSHRPR